MENLGRNDPCHCGSGKKYKKCCLAKDGEAVRAAQAAEMAPATTMADDFDLPEPPNPPEEQDPWNIRWKEFKATDYEGRFDLFARTLDDPELMDGEMASEMLGRLFDQTIEHGERDRFDALVQSLREKRPEVYAGEAHDCIGWRITNALVSCRSEDIPALAGELAALARKEIDAFIRIESQLAYHGHLSTLVDAMRLAWPQVKSSSDIVPWCIDGHQIRSTAYEILDYAERTSSPDATDPTLKERLDFYMEIDPTSLALYLAHLTGRAGRHWVMSDFELALPRRDWDEEEEEAEADGSLPEQPSGEQNLYHLTVEFLGYLRRVEDVPFAKGELGRRELQRFILDRHAGRLEYQESMLKTAQRDIAGCHGRRPPPRREFRPYSQILVPDRERLEHFLVGLLDMMNQLHYRVAAAFEIIPAWLRFLESVGLIDAEARTQALSDLAGVAGGLCEALDDFGDNPAPRLACAAWPEKPWTALPG